MFRDNQFTGDVNLSYAKGKHPFKYGFTYYHFDLNHFQPTSGGGASTTRAAASCSGRHDLRTGRLKFKGAAPPFTTTTLWPIFFSVFRTTAPAKRSHERHADRQP